MQRLVLVLSLVMVSGIACKPKPGKVKPRSGPTESGNSSNTSSNDINKDAEKELDSIKKDFDKNNPEKDLTDVEKKRVRIIEMNDLGTDQFIKERTELGDTLAAVEKKIRALEKLDERVDDLAKILDKEMQDCGAQNSCSDSQKDLDQDFNDFLKKYEDVKFSKDQRLLDARKFMEQKFMIGSARGMKNASNNPNDPDQKFSQNQANQSKFAQNKASQSKFAQNQASQGRFSQNQANQDRGFAQESIDPEAVLDQEGYDQSICENTFVGGLNVVGSQSINGIRPDCTDGQSNFIGFQSYNGAAANNLGCAKDEVLKGIDITYDYRLNGIRAICISGKDITDGKIKVSEMVGTPRGTSYKMQCPKYSAVVGLAGLNDSDVIDDLGVYCAGGR